MIAYASDMFSLFVGAFAFEESMPPPDVAAMGAAMQGLSPEEYPHLTSLSADLMAVWRPDGTFSYVPRANFFGIDSFRYRATDGRTAGAAATVTLTVTPVNDAPVAMPAQVQVQADGDVVGRVEAQDVDGPASAITYSLVTAPAHG